jgi:hypothetical protein
MKFTVQLVIEPGDGSKVVTEATLGLTLAESKTILAQLQESMVAQQAASYSTAHQTCPACGAPLGARAITRSSCARCSARSG